MKQGLTTPYDTLIWSIVHKFHPSSTNLMDYFQTAYLGLLKGLRSKTYDASRCQIETYCYRAAFRAVRDAHRKETRKVIVKTMDDTVVQKEKLWEILPDNLTEEEILSIQLSAEGHSLKEIGLQLGKTEFSIRTLMKAAREKIREANVPD